MRIEELHTTEKRHAVERTYHAAAKFFNEKSIGSGLLKKELTRLSAWHTKHAETAISTLWMNGYTLVIEELELTRKTVSYLEQGAQVLGVIDSTISMLAEIRNQHRLKRPSSLSA
jgi:hypothetical protein